MMKLSISTGLVAALLLASASNVMADQHHNNQQRYQYHKNGGDRVVVTKEVTENGIIIHKTITDSNGVRYTIDKKIEKGRHGSVDIEKKRNGQLIQQHHHSH